MKSKRKVLIGVLAASTMLAGIAPPASAQEDEDTGCIWNEIIQTYNDLFDPLLWPWQTPDYMDLLTSPQDHADLGIQVGEPQAWEDGMRTSLTESNFEWWYFDGHLDDGSTVVAVYYTKPQFGDPLGSEAAPYVQLDITRPDGTIISKVEPIDPAVSSFSTAGLDVQLGDNIAKDVHGDLTEFHITMAIDDTSIDLTLERTTPSWRPGTGIWSYGDSANPTDADEYFAWLPSVPNGELTGRITYDGVDHDVTGSGYHDHNWGNQNMTALMKDWWWTRSEVDGYTIIAVDLHMKNRFGNNTHMPAFVVLDEDEVLIDAVDVVANTGDRNALDLRLSRWRWHEDSGYFGFIPKRLRFELEDTNGDYARVTYNTTAMIASADLLALSGLPDSDIILARLLGQKPWYTRWQSDVRLQFDIDGVEFDGTGLGTVEFMELE